MEAPMASSNSSTPVLDLLTSMTLDSISASSLEPRELMIARLAALVAIDAPVMSYATNVETAVEVGIDAERAQGILAAVAPIVGTARVVSASTKLAEALALEVEEL
jgi:4-carboxymuconolactone decarboxylase